MIVKKNFQLWFLSFLFLISSGLSYSQKTGCQLSKQLLSPPGLYPCAENLRSDTIDILKYTVNLEIGNATNKWINGHTVVRLTPKMNNIGFVRLDLLKLTVDSVKENTASLSYTYNDTVLRISFSSPKNIGDTSNITVYYKGQPKGDASGWGGFYFDNHLGNQYAYNLGVGFSAKPHNYGRVWFPCFDNFVERSKYEFIITCDTTRRSYCNGQLISDVISNNKRTRTWQMNYEIPTYLASVAVANYRQVNWTVNTLTGVKPITLAGVAADTTAMKNGFVNLKSCINGFENYYGPYKWNRFGYCLVPFNSGAMEHATNIAYPRAAIGGLTYEADLMAHELSHHWWGDLITCETQEDMWINEGMATYSSYMFLEWQYGKNNYLNTVKTTHDNLLHFLHKQEGGFRAISGIPHSLTYGDHVYKKGADVAHTLRGYMGDTAFFNAIKYAMNQNQYKSINSIELRNMMQTSSGQNLTDFFNNWVLAGGWPHFSIDSVKYVQMGVNNVNAIVSVKQKLYGAPSLFSNVPLELSFFDNNWNKTIKKVTMSGGTSTFTVNIPFNAVYCALNFDTKINDATSFENKTVKAATNYNWNLGKVYMPVKNKGADSSLIRVVHHYVKPDPFKSNPQNHRLGDQHYWSIEGILSPGFHSKIRFNYDGNKTLGGTYSYLDTLLTAVNGDSIRVFYRANAGDDWKLVKNCIRFVSGLRTGFIELDTMKLGEYTFGNSADTATINSINQYENNFVSVKVVPNPVRGNFKVEFEKQPHPSCELELLDVEGRVIKTQKAEGKTCNVNVENYLPGTYFVRLRNQDDHTIQVKKVVLE